MKKVTKVMMFVWSDDDGRNDFLLVHHRKGDVVAPTGHIEKNESPKETVAREIEEETGAKPLKIIDLNYSIQAKLQEMNYLSTEHAFLVKVIKSDVNFVEYDEPSEWHKFSELNEIMTYPKQKGAIKNIEKYFSSIESPTS